MISQIDEGYSYNLRLDMVKEQLQRRGIRNADILEAFERIPRHLFVPHVDVDEAYGDYPIPIKAGQTISQPLMVAIMLQYLDVNPKHDVLEIGSGSGYATALLSRLAKHIDAIEVYTELLRDSEIALNRLGLKNIQLIHRSAWEQFEYQKVYDRIVLWASPPRIPDHLFECLGEGGVLVTPLGKAEQNVWIYTMRNGQLKKEKKDAVRFVPLVQGSTREIDGK